jgi:hypothetical protein
MTPRALRTLRGRSLLRIEPLEDRLLLATWQPVPPGPVAAGPTAQEAAPPQPDSPADPDGEPEYRHPTPQPPPARMPTSPPHRYQQLPEYHPGGYEYSADGKWKARQIAGAAAERAAQAAAKPTPAVPAVPPVPGRADPAATALRPKEGAGHSPPPATDLSQPVTGEEGPLGPDEEEQRADPPEAPEAKPQAAEDGPLAFQLPGLAADGWEQAGRQLLRALETLRAGGEGDSVWLRLAAWSLAGASSFVLYELTRQQLRERRRGELDPFPRPRLR